MHTTTTTPAAIAGIYKCLGDVNRLRILNLLCEAPRCVCHIEAVLGIGPVRTSQQLAYLRRHGLVEVAVRGTWRVYSLPAAPCPELAANLACLRESIFAGGLFRKDLVRLARVLKSACGPAAD